MKIYIKGYLSVKKMLGNVDALELDIESSTIRNLLIYLSVKYGRDFKNAFFKESTGQVNKENGILLNGHHYQHIPKGLETGLKEGDEISLFPPIAGG
ncbi:MoaD family protein [Spirochaetota bacterium]